MPIKYSTDEFIIKANKIHKGKYSYDKVNYLNSISKIIITCHIHGDFKQLPQGHLQGKGCKKCGRIVVGNKLRKEVKTKEERLEIYRKERECKFINKANIVHSNKYNYSKIEYSTLKEKLIIICPFHGTFSQTAEAHMKGSGCKKCSMEKITYTTSMFIEKSNEIFNNKYIYNLVEYKHSKVEVEIICPKHGIFLLQPCHHLQGRGCPKCKINNRSKYETEIAIFIYSLGYYNEMNTRKLLGDLELDIYIPELKKGIEFNGNWWHYNQDNPLCRTPGYHSSKSRRYKEIGIRVLHIREDLWVRDKEKMKQVIIKFLKWQGN